MAERAIPITTLACVALLVWVSAVSAQDVTGVRPVTGSHGFVHVQRSGVEAPGALSGTLWTHYARRPLVQRDADGAVLRARIDTLIGVEAAAAWGVVDRVEVGLAVPFGYVAGAGLADDGLQGVAGGDVRVVPRLRLLGDGVGFGLAVGLPVSLPVGDETRHLGSEGFTLGPNLVADWTVGSVLFALNAGYRHRTAVDRFANIEVGDSFTYAGAAGLGLGSSWRLFGEVVGSIGLGEVLDTSVVSPLEALLGARWAPTSGSHLTLAAGTGIVPDVGVPDLRVVLGVGLRGSTAPDRPVEVVPTVGDRDGDGLFDPVDACPEEAESWNDRDDRDGCPESPPPVVRVTRAPQTTRVSPIEVRITDDAIEIDEAVLFETDSATIAADSHALLDAVAATILDAIEVHHVLVEGHTDDRGSTRRNLRLSEARAAAVRDHLVSRGVEPSRLTAVGLGERRPVVEGRSAAARAANRRVRFRIATPEMLPRAVTAVTAEGPGPGLRITLDRPIDPADVRVAVIERGQVIIVVLPQTRTTRRWVPVKHPAIHRALLHPSVEAPPGAVLRVRLHRALPWSRRPRVVSADGPAIVIGPPAPTRPEPGPTPPMAGQLGP